MSKPIDRLIERLNGVAGSRGQYTARCPAHDDQHNSLSVGEGDDGRVLVNCHAGCPPEDVVKAASLEWADLFPDETRRNGTSTAKQPTLTVVGYAEHKQLDRKNLVTWGVHDGNGVVIPYFDTGGQERAQRIRKSKSGGFKWRKGDKPALYGLWRLDEFYGDYVIVVEGESDCHSLWQHDEAAVGVPGKSNWKDAWADHLTGFSAIYVVEEPDAERFTRDIALSMSERGRTVHRVKLSTKDASDLHLDDPETFTERLHEALSKAEPVEVDKTDAIDQIREEKGLKAYKRKRQIADTVIADLKRFGFFVEARQSVGDTGDAAVYFFDESKRRLYDLTERGFASLIEGVYGVNREEPEWAYLCSAIETEANLRGRKVTTRKFAHWDTDTGTLYIGNGPDVLKLDGETVETISNGSEVFFEPLIVPFEYDPDADNSELFSNLVVDPINFQATDTLSADEQRMLFLTWTFSLPFGDGLGPRPIALLTGDAGAGKTTVFKMLTQFLLGEPYYSILTEGDERDFLSMVYGNPLAFFDNLEKKPRWLDDYLSAVATGSPLTKRVLYTTNEQITFRPNCWLVINGIQPTTNRPDVADRMLVFNLARLSDEERKPESRMLSAIKDNRDELWSAYVNTLNQLVAKAREDDEEFHSPLRMTDWAHLGYQFASLAEHGDEFMRILRKMAHRQSEFAMDDHPLLIALEIWLDEGNGDEPLGAKDLLRELQDVADRESVNLGIENVQQLGRRLQLYERNLRELGIHIERTKSRGNRSLYRVNRVGEDE